MLHFTKATLEQLPTRVCFQMAYIVFFTEPMEPVWVLHTYRLETHCSKPADFNRVSELRAGAVSLNVRNASRIDCFFQADKSVFARFGFGWYSLRCRHDSDPTRAF